MPLRAHEAGPEPFVSGSICVGADAETLADGWQRKAVIACQPPSIL
jgi:hypothetical protein